jgi:hypothetical protein
MGSLAFSTPRLPGPRSSVFSTRCFPIVGFPTKGFELVLDKTAEITYFLDAKPLFDIPHLNILDFGLRIAEFKFLIFPLNAGLMGAKRLRRG